MRTHTRHVDSRGVIHFLNGCDPVERTFRKRLSLWMQRHPVAGEVVLAVLVGTVGGLGLVLVMAF